jgi:hypothetical protein
MDALRELVLPRLEGVRPTGGGSFEARCPAHDDRKPSLTVSPGREHPVVFHCHVNCHPDDILGKLGLTWEDLSAPRDDRPSPGEWTPAGPATAVYDYRDETGTLLFQVLRTATKDFRQRVPDPAAKSGWTWRLGDVRRVLFRLPEVITAVSEGREIWITEGEKDALSLVSMGLVGTCSSGGAGKWRDDYAEHLREAVVTICADRDEPGQAHARTVAQSLAAVGATVRIVEAASGKDVTDHLNAGLGLEDLVETWANDEQAKPDLAPDLWEFISTQDAPYDWIVPGLLERGDRLMLTGFEGLGKSVLTRQLAVTMAAGLHPFTFEDVEPARVLFVDCENTTSQSRRKFRQLAELSVQYQRRVGDGALRLIHRPEGIDLTRDDDAAWLLERVTAHKPDVLFIGPFYRLHAANLNDELPARKTIAALDQARTKVGCALVMEAHAGHGEGLRGRQIRPTGSSLLLRWPEFGYGIRPADGSDGHLVDFLAWRGARDERDWPTHLVRGKAGQWPWLVATGIEIGRAA